MMTFPQEVMEKLSLCSCGRDKAVFICMKETCPSFNFQTTYCQQCSQIEEDKHDHGTVAIPTKTQQLGGLWMKTNEKAGRLL
jgi:hypothetical protein